MKVSALFLPLALCCVALSAGAEDLSGTLLKVKESGTLTLGYRESSVPFSYLDAEGKPVGYAFEVCRAVGESVKKRLNMPDLKIRYQPVTSANRIPLIQNGTVDIECGSTTNSLVRQRQAAFGISYFGIQVSAAVNKNSGIRSFKDLDGKNVTVTAGTTSVALLKAYEKKEGILSGKFRKRDAILYYFDKMLFYGIAGFFNLLLNYAVIMKIYSFPMRGAQADFLLFSACFVFCLLGFGALLGLLCKNSLHAMQWLMALTYPFFVLAGFSWPHTEMPDFLVQIANYLPVTHYLGPVRSIILMGIGFERASLQHNRAMLLTLGIGAFLLSFVVFAWQLCRAEKKQKAAEKNTQTEGVQA